jgi:hypothetical protein
VNNTKKKIHTHKKKHEKNISRILIKNMNQEMYLIYNFKEKKKHPREIIVIE